MIPYNKEGGLLRTPRESNDKHFKTKTKSKNKKVVTIGYFKIQSNPKVYMYVPYIALELCLNAKCQMPNGNS